MIGVPPVCGFVSKWYLALGSMDIHNWIILSVLLVSSLLNAGYFVPIIIQAFFGKPLPEDEGVTSSLEKNPLIMFMVVPLTITAIFSVIFGFYPDFFIKVVASADTNFFSNIIKGIAGL
jgi:multicomponent Na+:H+ antiporter subunit D